MGLEDFDRVFLISVGFGKALVIVEIDKVGRSVILTSLVVFWAVPSEVSYFSALEAGIR